MAYMNQERKAKISAAIKPILKKYGIKATLAVRNHMTICLNIKAGSIDFISNYLDTVKSDNTEFVKRYRSIDVNTYHYEKHFSGVAKSFLEEAMMALKGTDWYDRSDIMTDYFDTAYYVDINIGQWNKPYQVV
jgi:hypothetical protein